MSGATSSGRPSSDRSWSRPLYYLVTGLFCLLAIAFARGRLSLPALACALVAAACGFLVYRWWVPPAATAAAAAAAWLAASSVRKRQSWTLPLGLAGLALAAFALLGPRDGLF